LGNPATVHSGKKWVRGMAALLALLLSPAVSFPAANPAVRAAPPVESSPPPAPAVSAEAAALIDVRSGRIIYSKNGDEPRLIASLTKIMTAIVAIEYGDLSDRVKVGRNAFGKEGSSLYLQLGEEMSLENMLYGLMLRSGNDAATAIAEHVGGSVEGFAYLMNRKAEELGLAHTHFVNPHGLDEEGHYASANDLARLTAYALRNPTFQEIVRTPVKTVPNPNGKWNYRWRNKNKMLLFYEGADGVKTGYTKAAGRGLVSSATRNGQQLAVVTLNAPNDWSDHTALLNYGFAHYPLETIVRKGQKLDHTALVPAASVVYPLAEAEKGGVRLIVQPDRGPERVDNVRFGVRGKLVIELNGRTIATVDLIEPAEDSPVSSLRAGPWERLRSQLATYFARLPDAVRTVWRALV
jgi:D-alanyl-D-alanine carboxypeptidase